MSCSAGNGEQPQGAQPEGDQAQRASRVVTGAGGVVFNPNGRVLLLKHASGDWVFPKGHLDEGETALQAALREVAEEAGVTASCEHDEERWVTRYRNSRGEQREITWFHCHTPATEVHITEELFSTGGFFATEEALKLLSHSQDRQLLGKVAAFDAARRAEAEL